MALYGPSVMLTLTLWRRQNSLRSLSALPSGSGSVRPSSLPRKASGTSSSHSSRRRDRGFPSSASRIRS